MRLAFLLPFSALIATAAVACRPLVCTEMGCVGSLTLVVVRDFGEPVPYVEGEVTVGDVTHVVNCGPDGGSTADVHCGEGEIRFDPGEDGDLVTWTLRGWDEESTGADPAPYNSEGEETPAWSEFSPNGEACGPTCRGAEITVPMETLD